MKRRHITATQLADFWRCPRKAYFTDRLGPEEKDPTPPLRDLIYRAGDDFETKVVAETPGVVAIDRKTLGIPGAFAETKKLMGDGVPAIHHGLLLGTQNGTEYLAESDLLIREPGEGGKYRIREIKNSRHPSSPQALQLALNIWLLRQTGFAAEHHEIFHRGDSRVITWSDVDGVFNKYRSQLLTSLHQPNPPGFYQKAPCSGCDWKGICFRLATEEDDLGLVPGLGEKDRILLNNAAVHTRSDLIKFGGPPPLFEDPLRLGVLKERAKAQELGKRLAIPGSPQWPSPPPDTWLLHLGFDLPETKEPCLWAGQNWASGETFSFSGTETSGHVQRFFTTHREAPFLTTTDLVLHDLRHDLLPRLLVGNPKHIHGAKSAESLLGEVFAWPGVSFSLRDYLAIHRASPAPLPDPLEKFFESPAAGEEAAARLLAETTATLKDLLWT